MATKRKVAPPPAAEGPAKGADMVGREWLLEEILAWLQPSGGLGLLVGQPGIGKSAVLQALYERVPQSLLVRIHPSLGTHTPEGFWTYLLDQVDLEGKRLPTTPRAAASLAAEHLPLDGDLVRLVLVDGLEGCTDLLEWWPSVPGVHLLAASRPASHLVPFEQSGARLFCLSADDPRNLADLRAYLKARGARGELLQSLAHEAQGNYLVAANLLDSGLDVHQLELNPERLDRALWSLIGQILAGLGGEQADDARRVLCLLCEAGEPLDADSLADFLGLSVGRVRGLLSHLDPILHPTASGYRLFHPRLNLTLARYLQRDLVAVHASVVAYFRETFPSWDEMNDRYGWYYLGHHCERYAQTSRKRDYSVLHWLGEGAFIRLKLQRTRSLKGVLDDLTRGLRAALEEQDLPRIVHYGLQIPRLRSEEAATGLHELADLGQLDLARERAGLLARESSRFKAFLLLAWQALDEELPELTRALLDDALAVPLPILDDEDGPLVVRIAADLAEAIPERRKDCLALLDREESPGRAAALYLGLSRLENLSDNLRLGAIEAAIQVGNRLESPERERLLAVLAGSLKDHSGDAALRKLLPRVAGAEPEARFTFASQSEPMLAFLETLAQVSSDRLEPRRVNSLMAIAEALAATEGEGWTFEAFQQLMQLVVQVRQPQERLRAIFGLSRCLTLLGARELSMGAFERLAAVAETLEEPGLRSRALADIGLSLHKLREVRESSSKISEAAALAFRIEDQDERARTLAFVAGTVAQFGHRLRSRDLAFNSLQVHEAPSLLPFDQNCRASLKLGVMATISHEKSLEYLQVGAETMKRSDMLEPHLRAATLATLASGALRLGSLDWARKLLNQAEGAARAMEPGAAKAVTLAGLAANEAEAGDSYRAEQVLQEAVEAIEPEPFPAFKAEGYIAIAVTREAMRDSRFKAAVEAALMQLETLDGLALGLSRALLDLSRKAQRWQIAPRVARLIKKAREALSQAPDRDQFQLALVRVDLGFGEIESAHATQRKIQGTQARSQALSDIAVRLILQDPEESLRLLAQIPLRAARMHAVRRCTVELNCELRPSHLKLVRETLVHLTMLSTADENTADLVVSRWVYYDQDPRRLERTARKMGWVVEDGMTPLTPQPARELSSVQLRQSV